MNFVPSEAEKELACPSQDTIDRVCPKCPLFETKPGTEPVHLRAALSDALELEELIDIGIVPTFSEALNGALTARQLAALKGLKSGRNRAENTRNQDTIEKVRRQQQESGNNPLARPPKPKFGGESSF